VICPEKPSSSKRCFIRSESGNTVDEPAVTIAPLTASGAYIAKTSGSATKRGSSITALVAVGSTTGAAVGVAAGPQAANANDSTKTTDITMNNFLDILFLLLVFI
jgi:hypothetical protein